MNWTEAKIYTTTVGIDHITGAILPHKSSTESFEDAIPPREPEDIPTIRKLPKYDPDAEISSLTLTIPSWVSSIHRTCSNAPFDNISDGAKYKLRCQLFELKNAIFTIEKTMEGYGND